MYTEKMHKALRRDTQGKHNVVTDLLDEIERLQEIIRGNGINDDSDWNPNCKDCDPDHPNCDKCFGA